MKKKLLLLTVLVMAFVCLFVISSSAATFDKTEKVTVTLTGGATQECALYDDDGDELVWYTLDNGATLISIKAKNLFYSSKTELKDIYLEEGGTALQLSSETATNHIVVANFRGMEFETLPHNSYKSTFNNSTMIQYVYYPSTIKNIYCNQFQNCTNLKVLDFPSDAKFAFLQSNFAPGATALKELNLTGLTGVTGNSHFSGCSSLDTIIGLEKSTTEYIGAKMFKGTAITEVRLPNTVTKIGEGAFNGCKSLKVAYLGANATTWEINSNFSASDAFNSSGIEVVYMPATMTAVAGYAFSNATSLKAVIYTGTKDQAIAMYNNSVMTNNAPFQNLGKTEDQFISYEAYLALPANDTGTYIVYGMNHCDAFYDGIHLDNDANCLTKCDDCDRALCNVAIEAKEKHATVHTVVYENGFLMAGVHNTICTNDGCTAGNSKEDLRPMFVADGYSYKTAGETAGISVKYTINTYEFGLYQTHVSKLSVGVIVANAEHVGADTFINADGILNTAGKGIQVTLKSDNYSTLTCTVNGFKNEDKYLALKLVMSAYVYEVDENGNKTSDVTYIQKVYTKNENETDAGYTPYAESIERDSTLGVVTISQVKAHDEYLKK